MVMWLTSNDFNIIKIHTMITVVNMASKFRVVIEHHDSLFVFRNPLFYDQTVSPLLLFLVNGARERNVIPATKRGDRAMETGWSTV